MNYIWINPVVKQMYDKNTLDSFLRQHGYQQVECEQDWARHVRDLYRKTAETTKYPIADVRCPVISRLLWKEYADVPIHIPNIEPILMHCAREISSREDLKGQEKLIITPCQALADMGNQARLLDTLFLSWKAFVKELGGGPRAAKLEKSPIPPGFFDSLEGPVRSFTGEGSIREYLEHGTYEKVRITEFLWCPEGCHHGDGVINLE